MTIGIVLTVLLLVMIVVSGLCSTDYCRSAMRRATTTLLSVYPIQNDETPRDNLTRVDYNDSTWIATNGS